MQRREFIQALAVAAAGGLALHDEVAAAEQAAGAYYDLPPFGNVGLLHLTDCHAQLEPMVYREPSVNLGVGAAAGHPPHEVGAAVLARYGIAPGSREAYALTSLDFVRAARLYGRMGGFAQLATLVARLRAVRPGCLLLDGGDTWQGTGPSLWTRGQDMVEAARLLGIDVMTLHWEFTYGADRVRQVEEGDFKGRIDIVAQNVRTADFDEPVFKPYVLREVGKVPIAVIGQAYPYTPIAHPRTFVQQWSFGIQEKSLQAQVGAAREKGAQAVILLSHNGMDVDLKLASRVRGIDAILGGHTHDAVARPVLVANAGGSTVVTNAGCNGKFLGVLDLEVRGGRVVDYRYRLLPVFAGLLPPDPAMQSLIARLREPHLARLRQPLATTEALLYRRGNFNGSFDQLIVEALMAERGAEIALSPGFRWGTALLPGETITMEALMQQTAITYPIVTVTMMSGARIKAVLEDVCDNLFNPDPYYQQGGDMVRVGGLRYSCTPAARMGARIGDLELRGKPLQAERLYKVAGWAPVSEQTLQAGGEPVWDVVARYLLARKTVPALRPNTPVLKGVGKDRGLGRTSGGES
ncbi:MAG TPA: thiosulfohydrolase SoxB [Burkholderiaceae bacterium]|nr:thiosulfohydrolase SoxB [Burkholderiaceae bacterium]